MAVVYSCIIRLDKSLRRGVAMTSFWPCRTSLLPLSRGIASVQRRYEITQYYCASPRTLPSTPLTSPIIALVTRSIGFKSLKMELMAIDRRHLHHNIAGDARLPAPVVSSCCPAISTNTSRLLSLATQDMLRCWAWMASFKRARSIPSELRKSSLPTPYTITGMLWR